MTGLTQRGEPTASCDDRGLSPTEIEWSAEMGSPA